MFTMFQAPAFKGRWMGCRGQRPWRTCVHALPRCDAARTLVAAAARWWRPSAAERGGAGQRDAAVRGCHAAMQLGLGAVRNVLTRLGSPHRALSLLARAPEALVQAGVYGSSTLLDLICRTLAPLSRIRAQTSPNDGGPVSWSLGGSAYYDAGTATALWDGPPRSTARTPLLELC